MHSIWKLTIKSCTKATYFNVSDLNYITVQLFFLGESCPSRNAVLYFPSVDFLPTIWNQDSSVIWMEDVGFTNFRHPSKFKSYQHNNLDSWNKDLNASAFNYLGKQYFHLFKAKSWRSLKNRNSLLLKANHSLGRGESNNGSLLACSRHSLDWSR